MIPRFIKSREFPMQQIQCWGYELHNGITWSTSLEGDGLIILNYRNNALNRLHKHLV